jgi:hypothetical protein
MGSNLPERGFFNAGTQFRSERRINEDRTKDGRWWQNLDHGRGANTGLRQKADW